MKNRFFLVSFLLLFSGILIFAATPVSAQNKFVPPDGKVLLLIGQGKPYINAYLKNIRIVPAGFMTYTSIQEIDGLARPSPDRGAGVHHAQYFVDKYPDTALQIGLYMVGALEGVLSGQYDANIQEMGQWFKQINRPVYLRIGYEFDLRDNRYDPVQYKRAFRYIVDKLRQQGVNNVAYVWHSTGFLTPDLPWMSWYPGDDYVDWFALSFFDCYNWSNMKMFSKLARQHGKPLMLAEAAPAKRFTSEGEKVWNIWFTKFFQFIEEENVKTVGYIDTYWDVLPMFKAMNWGDSRIETNPFIKKHWIQEIQKDKYLRSSSGLFQTISFH